MINFESFGGTKSIQYHVNVLLLWLSEGCAWSRSHCTAVCRLLWCVSCDVTLLIVRSLRLSSFRWEVFAGLCCALISSLSPVIFIQTPGRTGSDPRTRHREHTLLTIEIKKPHVQLIFHLRIRRMIIKIIFSTFCCWHLFALLYVIVVFFDLPLIYAEFKFHLRFDKIKGF